MNRIGVQTSSLDIFKWFLILLIVAGGVLGNFYLGAQPILYRFVGLVLLASVAFYLAYQTEKGKQTWQFFQDAKLEVRKIVWPSREETSQTTVVVVIAVLVMAVLLWIIDTVLFKLMQLVTG